MFDHAPVHEPATGTPSTAGSTIPDPAVALAEQATELLRELTSTAEPHDHSTALDRVRALEQTAAALAAARLQAISQADRAGAYTADGAPTMASWLHNTLGTPARTARADTTTAAFLNDLPATSDALRDGTLTAEHAGAIAQTARRLAIADGTDLGSLDQDLAALAGQIGDVDEFRRELRHREHAHTADAIRQDADRAARLRTARIGQRPDGLWELHAIGDQASIETIGTAIRAFTRPDPSDTPPELARTHGMRLFDGLVDACNAALNAGTAPTVGGVRPHVGIIVPIETLTDPDVTGSGGTAEVTGPISADMARRLTCDASLYRIVMSGQSEPLDLGRATRDWTVAQRRAAVARDRSCRGPSCDRPAAWCELHHIDWWTRDHGPTDIDNALLLCHHCHTLVHDRSWQLVFDPAYAVATWTSPNGTVTTNRQKVLQPQPAVAQPHGHPNLPNPARPHDP